MVALEETQSEWGLVKNNGHLYAVAGFPSVELIAPSDKGQGRQREDNPQVGGEVGELLECVIALIHDVFHLSHPSLLHSSIAAPLSFLGIWKFDETSFASLKPFVA